MGFFKKSLRTAMKPTKAVFGMFRKALGRGGKGGDEGGSADGAPTITNVNRGGGEGVVNFNSKYGQPIT